MLNGQPQLPWILALPLTGVLAAWANQHRALDDPAQEPDIPHRLRLPQIEDQIEGLLGSGGEEPLVLVLGDSRLHYGTRSDEALTEALASRPDSWLAGARVARLTSPALNALRLTPYREAIMSLDPVALVVASQVLVPSPFRLDCPPEDFAARLRPKLKPKSDDVAQRRLQRRWQDREFRTDPAHAYAAAELLASSTAPVAVIAPARSPSEVALMGPAYLEDERAAVEALAATYPHVTTAEIPVAFADDAYHDYTHLSDSAREAYERGLSAALVVAFSTP